MEKMCKEELKQLIRSTNFAVIELGLYLDTHPTSACALTKYHNLKNTLKDAIAVYEKNYGPLSIYGVKCEEEWTWVNEPWPWQEGGSC
ncbi:MAG: spore coat protein CotJB [Lachnospiraceae bacterium]|nr:spore coat protein CotJB [Lachnospiraceae bacterium]